MGGPAIAWSEWRIVAVAQNGDDDAVKVQIAPIATGLFFNFTEQWFLYSDVCSWAGSYAETVLRNTSVDVRIDLKMALHRAKQVRSRNLRMAKCNPHEYARAALGSEYTEALQLLSTWRQVGGYFISPENIPVNGVIPRFVEAKRMVVAYPTEATFNHVMETLRLPLPLGELNLESVLLAINWRHAELLEDYAQFEALTKTLVQHSAIVRYLGGPVAAETPVKQQELLRKLMSQQPPLPMRVFGQ